MHTTHTPTCDCRTGNEPCAAPPKFVCICDRCDREPDDEKFYACAAHPNEAGERHTRIRDRRAAWSRL